MTTNGTTHGVWALVRLDTGSVERAAWPVGLEDETGGLGGAAAGVRLLARHPEALVLACGPLTGVAAPGTCLLVATCAGPDGRPVHTPLLLRHGPALKAAGVDFLVLEGRAAEPALLTVEHRAIRLGPARDLAGADVFAMRSRLRARLPDARPSLLLCGPAARRGLACAAASLEAGQSLDRGLLAGWLAAHNLLAVILAGGGSLPGPASLDTPLFAALSPQHGPAGFVEVLGWYGSGMAVGSPPGRAAACHLCPRPCLAYLPGAAGPAGAEGGVLCADHAGYAALAAALGEAAPSALHACSRFGFDALALAPVLAGRGGEDPAGLCAAWAEGRESLPAPAPAPEAGAPSAPEAWAGGRRAAGMVLGICPILMQRCPEVLLDLWTAGRWTGETLNSAIAAAGLNAT